MSKLFKILIIISVMMSLVGCTDSMMYDEETLCVNY